MSFCGKIIGFYDKRFCSEQKLNYRPYVDFFVLCGCNIVDLEMVVNAYAVDLLIIDQSVPDYCSDIIALQAEELGQKYYRVKEKGAFVFEN